MTEAVFRRYTLTVDQNPRHSHNADVVECVPLPSHTDDYNDDDNDENYAASHHSSYEGY